MDFNKCATIDFDDCTANKKKKYTVNRNLFLDKDVKPKYKYKETITFDKKIKIGKRAICIGLNPAKAEKKIDTSNRRLISLLWDNYDGYDLYNFYPEITDNKKQINMDDTENCTFVNHLVGIVTKNTDDIVLFFGRTAVIPRTFVDSFLDKEHERKIYITVHNGEFTHPGSNAEIQLKSFQKNYVNTASVIKVK